MKVDVLLGLQWGDEGKGKVVDFLAPNYDLIVRFQGGPNAGHTLEFDGIKHVLHQIPSGIFREDCLNIIGNGVVLDPVIFQKEVTDLLQFDIKAQERLKISKKAHLILPTHRLLDQAQEAAKGEDKIGSTLKGIGPTYQDKTGRRGIRVGDIITSDFSKRLDEIFKIHLEELSRFDFDISDFGSVKDKFLTAVDFLKTFELVDSEYLINRALDEGHHVLAEGAQGSLLDLDFGSYPFVTSSNTTIAGVCSGMGVAPHRIGEVFGIFKAYCTRVGSGPFPTELFDEVGKKLQKEGHEFGATTGRPRRCGWLDLVALRYSCMLNGVTKLYMMKSDVLNLLDEIQYATAYLGNEGKEHVDFPFSFDPDKYTPLFQKIEGWRSSLDDVGSYQELPRQLKEYISLIESYVKAPISLVSYGPERDKTILRENIAV